jgi:hypothetical protein
VQVSAAGVPHAVMWAGIELANRRSKSGEPPLNATPEATTVVDCPTAQHGPAGARPVSDPLMQVPPGQSARTEHGRLALLLHTRVVRGPALPAGREHESAFRSVNLALVMPVVGLRMKLNWLMSWSAPSNALSGSGQPSKS